MESIISYHCRDNAAVVRGLRRRSLIGALSALVAMGFVATATPARALGQSAQVGGPWEQYMRVLQVGGLVKAGSFFLQPLPTGALSDSAGPWARDLGVAPTHALGAAQWVFDPARLRLSDNTGLPYGQNDDAMWQGKGVNFALDGGATMTWGRLTVTAHPTLAYAQNESFPLAPVGVAGATQYAYPWRSIDLPQRFGPNSYARLDPGQSNVSLTLGGAKIGFGTENLWWGPGIQNSIVMTNNAPGFPHASLATSHPIDILGLGTVEGQWIWGRLQESGWYSGPDAGKGRFFTGAEAAFTPSWSFFKGLTVGGARTFVRNVPAGGLSAADYLAVLQNPVTKAYSKGTYEDDRDQIVSFQFRWVMPASGFETYGEWARNDHGRIPLDILLVPQHSQGYTLGFQKVQSLDDGSMVVLNGELTHLELDNTAQRWPDPSYYAHSVVLRGSTQRGQLIASALGPGGDGEHVGVDLYNTSGRWGVYALRQVHDNDAFYALSKADTLLGPDVTLGFGARALVFVNGMEVEFDLARTGEADRYFIKDNGVWNTHAEVTVRWRPR